MTPLALLAPDQRAVLELVLRQDRSYGELSELLGIPEREVREPAPAPRPRPLRDEPPAPRPRPLRDEPAAPRTSRAGGAALIAAVVLVLVAVLVWPVNLLGVIGNDDTGAPAAASGPTPTATPSSLASQATGNDVVLRGVGSNAKADGLMRLFKAQNGAVQFAIGAEGVPNNAKGESYAVWFTRKGGKPKLLGFPQTQVTNGVLTVGGPTKADEKAFPTWFATYDNVLITRETKAKPAAPGPVVLQGTLPHGKSGG